MPRTLPPGLKAGEPGDQMSVGGDRRNREAQRQAVRQVLPDEGEASLLRTPDGLILVYEEEVEKRRPVTLRAVVMPDGQVLETEHDRFKRVA
jgi:hypothetical protein